MSTTNVLLVFGGESAEHEVSIRSAKNVFDALDKERYDVSLCYIDRSGIWWRAEEVAEQKSPTNKLMPLLGEGAFADSNGSQLRPDIIFPALHGPNGEDGSVQGLAQLLHIPIAGCGIASSAVCMDKDVTKRLLMQAGITVVPGIMHYREDAVPFYNNLIKQLGGNALFVKPANMGSSVGVNKATNEDEFAHALEEAHRHDRKVLIERAIKGRELECAVLGNEQPEASVVGEIMPGDAFYSYDEKYAEDSKATTSAHISLPDGVSDKIRET